MYMRLLVPVDGSDLSERAMHESLVLAKQLGASVIGFVVESVAPLPAAGMHLTSYERAVNDHDAGSEDHAQRVLSQFATAADDAGVPFTGRFTSDDDVPAAIAHAAVRYDVDMVIMVTHGRGVFGELLFGSHTKAVMALTAKPLLVLH